jgi:hypothetical protein
MTPSTRRKEKASTLIVDLAVKPPAIVTLDSAGSSAGKAEEPDEAEVFRTTFLDNFKTKTVDPEKRPLIVFLNQKKETNKNGWLRKALYPDAARNLSEPEKLQILLLSTSLIGTTDSTKTISYAWGVSQQSIRNTWNVDQLSASTSSSCTAQVASILPADDDQGTYKLPPSLIRPDHNQ